MQKKYNLSTVFLNFVKNSAKKPTSQKPDGKTEKPNRELCAFEKTSLLSPNQAEDIEIVIPISKLNSYDEETASYYLEQGTYAFFVGNSVDSAEKCGEFTLNDAQVVKQVKNSK